MTDNNELLLNCLRRESPETKQISLRSFQDSHWDAILCASNRDNTTPLLYYTLNSFFSVVNVPDQIRKQLREAYLWSSARNIRAYQQLLNLVRAFAHERVSVILLKGAHLAELVYGNSALRPMEDLDLLVRVMDLKQVSELLDKMGYRASHEDSGRALQHLPRFTKENSLDIEVHFNIVDPPFSGRFDVSELWERARLDSIQGAGVLTLCPEDLLLHLCLHTSGHHCFDNGIMPFVDVSRALDRYENQIDWNKAVATATKWGAVRCMYLMLALTEKMVGLKVPQQVKEQIDQGPAGLAAVASAQDLVFEKAAPIAPNIARLFGAGSRSDKLRILVSRVFPPSEVMPALEGREIGEFAAFRTYLYRIRGVWKRHGKTVWRALLGHQATMESVGIENTRNHLRDWVSQL